MLLNLSPIILIAAAAYTHIHNDLVVRDVFFPTASVSISNEIFLSTCTIILSSFTLFLSPKIKAERL